MDLEQFSVLFVIFFFIAAEIRRILIGRSGVIEEFLDSGPMAAFLPVLQVRVRMANGASILCKLNGCSACIGRLEKGDRVRVVKTKDGHCLDLPWIDSRKRKKAFLGRNNADSSCCYQGYGFQSNEPYPHPIKERPAD